MVTEGRERANIAVVVMSTDVYGGGGIFFFIT